MSCSNSVEKYYDKPVKELRQGEEYKQTYNKSLSKLNNGTFDKNYDFWVKDGGGSIEDLILASKYHFRPVSFIDIKEGEWEQHELAILDAIDFHFKNKHGDKFWDEIENEAIRLDQQYNVSQYDTLLPNIISKSYTRKFINDSIEVGILNTSDIDSLPFYLAVDTASSFNNSENYKLEKTGSQIIFRATKRHFKDTTKFLLPTAYVFVFWDSSKTDFPYFEYPLAKVSLQSKYQWKGSSKGLVDTDEK